MKRADKEITGKNRIQKELEANGRKRIKDTLARIEKNEKTKNGMVKSETIKKEIREKETGKNKTMAGKTGGIQIMEPQIIESQTATGDGTQIKESTGSEEEAAEEYTGMPDGLAADTDNMEAEDFAVNAPGSPKQDICVEGQKADSSTESISADKQGQDRLKNTTKEMDELQAGKKVHEPEAVLKTGGEAALKDLKEQLFQEKKHMDKLRKEIGDMQAELEKEKKQFAEYVKAKEYSMEMDQKRLEQENRFFDQKMKILQGGFEQLEEDRRNFQKERDKFTACKEVYTETQDMFKRYETTEMLFRGVNSFLALKKRYKDLIKMFHPDNVAGDHEMVQLINQEYEELKKAYDVGRQA